MKVDQSTTETPADMTLTKFKVLEEIENIEYDRKNKNLYKK